MGDAVDPFAVDPTLAADSVPIGEFTLSHVRLMDERRYPWVVLIPRRANTRELFELDRAQQHDLISEIDRASRALHMLFTPDKINVGAIGNVVTQLHVHVVARYRGDPAWPKPVWGASPREPYGVDARAARVQRIVAALWP